MRTLTVLIALFWSAGATGQTIAPGHILGNTQGQVVNGWKQTGGGLYPLRQTANFTTVERNECCYEIFTRGDEYLLILSEAVARNAKGGVEATRVKKTFRVRAAPGETELQCHLLWIDPVISFYNTKTKVIRSIVIGGDEFIEVKWFDPGGYCDHGD